MEDKNNLDIDDLTSELLDIIDLGKIVKMFKFEDTKKDGYFDFKKDSFYCLNCSSTNCHCADAMNDDIWSDLYQFLDENKDIAIKLNDSLLNDDGDDIKLLKLLKTELKGKI